MPRRLNKTVGADKWAPVVQDRAIADLRPHPTNPKTHGEKSYQAIARSIAAHKFVNPILIGRGGVIIAGHARYEAAKVLGMTTVPVIELGHLTPAQERAYRIADNRLSENGEWDIALLKVEMEAVIELDADFDLELTGFSMRDLTIGADVSDAKSSEPDIPVPDVPRNPVTNLGDLWRIGDHLVICGDALNADAYKTLMGRERAAMIFTDVPYNVPVQGHVSGNGKVKHREFIEGSGEKTDQEFREFILGYMTLCAKYSENGSLHYHFIDWRGVGHMIAAGSIAYEEYKNLIVWNKTNGGMGSMYRSQHELIGLFKKGAASHKNHVELGKYGRNRTNVWSYPGMNSFSRDRDDVLSLHPSVKPTDLVRDAIFDASMRDDIVLDPFGGSGTTLLAADAARRRARLIELDPGYCDVILTRAEQALGISAVLVATGQTFAQVAVERESAHV